MCPTNQNAEGVNLDLHQLGVGHHPAAPVVILHQHFEGHQLRVLGAEPNQLVYTCPLEVIPLLVKGHVVGVTRGPAGAVGDWVAVSDAFYHLALLPCSATFILALHAPTSRNTATPSFTGLVGPEGVPSRNVVSLVGAAAASRGYTLTSTQNEACVTGTSLHTGGLAFRGGIRIRASGRTGTAT